LLSWAHLITTRTCTLITRIQLAFYRIDQIEMIEGLLAKREQRLVEAWIVLHQNELLENWDRLQSSKLPFKIAPLK